MKGNWWTARFERACRKEQVRLSLGDWTLHFQVEKGDGTRHAHVEYSCESRQAGVTSFIDRKGPNGTDASPERIARHEMYHLAMADLIATAARLSSDTHPDVVREEHRAIERFLNAERWP